jgi:hypothetical protein
MEKILFLFEILYIQMWYSIFVLCETCVHFCNIIACLLTFITEVSAVRGLEFQL